MNEPASQNDRNGWDVHIEPVNMDNSWVAKPELYIQLKSTVSPAEHEEFISFSLDVKTYQKLTRSCMKSKTVLGLLCLDKDPRTWLSITAEELVLKRTMYWYKLETGLPINDGQEHITIHIPRRNVLDQKALHKMIITLANEEEISNEL